MATRTQLVEALLESAWHGEIVRRVQEIESGAVELEDGLTAMSKLRARALARLARRGW